MSDDRVSTDRVSTDRVRTDRGGSPAGRGSRVRHLPTVVPAPGEPPEDIGTGHPMREVTERIAADPTAWTPELAREVGGFFDELAPGWSQGRTDRSAVLLDALERGGPFDAPVLELGAGTGAGTRLLAERLGRVVAGDLAPGMIERLPATLAERVRLDASRLPVRAGSVGTLVCMNMFLFADEVRRVLRPGGALVWVNSMGPRTPIHLSAEAVAAALGPDVDVVASMAQWGTWAVARPDA